LSLNAIFFQTQFLKYLQAQKKKNSITQSFLQALIILMMKFSAFMEAEPITGP